MLSDNKYRLLIPILVSAMLAACSTSPTGRTQLLMHSPDELNQMGARSFDEMKKQETISQDVAVNKFVQCVADAITVNVDSSVHQGSWEVVVFDSDMVNAFALPGGKIGVYTGILEVTENAGQLAAIVGHEVGHVIAQHSNERLSSDQISKVGLAVAGTGLALSDVDNKALILAGMGIGVQYGILMPYGRTHETEADIIGQELMAKSGFDPSASVALWRNMAKAGGGEPPEWLSTHPSNQTRINNLSKHLEKSEPMYAAATTRPQCPKPKIPTPKKSQ
ncbi:M48 family metallopeptidase [Thalassotalea mangrovi]|uniref:M48 family metallopeptidase n=1 Tax=Thalassotalea mangrovi TaxID=2572245 RepID=A0A4U1B2F4_9GAMM|nr:M48 family metallopeptidase [Thalassotalea mangrovi]TKB43849.1 M48 family metallopeptidase [Thalassotalea mangrovi]